MSTNPYAPPVAEVADHQPIANIEKPLQIVLAVRMLWTSVALSIVSAVTLVTTSVALPFSTLIPAFVGIGITVSLMAWLVTNISRGRNWARVTFLVLMLFSASFVIWRIFFLPGYSPYFFGRTLLDWTSLRTLFSLIQTVLQYTATALLFIGPGRRWFARRE